VRPLLQLEDDERRGLLRVVGLRVDAVRVPSEREEPHGFDSIDRDLEPLPFVGLLGLRHFGVDRSGDNLTRQGLARDERAVEAHTEPAAEFLRVADGAPHALEWSTKQRLLYDA